MRGIVDNNLPLTFTRRIIELVPEAEIGHVIDLGAQDLSDSAIKRRWEGDPVIWITRDEDFWLDSPPGWAVVWVSCHNPRLAFLRDELAPVIGELWPRIEPGSRLLVTESFASFM